MKIKTLYFSLFLVLLCKTGSANAGPLTLAPIATGVLGAYSDSYLPQTEYYHSTPLSNLSNLVWFLGGVVETGYAIYDLRGLHGDVNSASVNLDLTFGVNVDPTHTMSIYGLSLAETLLALPEGDITAAQRQALAPTSQLGIQSGPTASGQGLYTISLNQSGLDLIAGRGLLVLSLQGFSLDYLADGNVGFNGAPLLVLDGNNVVDIPASGTLSLVVVAGLALTAGRRSTIKSLV